MAKSPALLTAAALLLLGAVLHAADPEPRQRIENLMSSAEFTEAGLERLTPAELAALNRWLYGHVEREKEAAVEEALPSGERAFGLEHVTDRVRSMFRNTPEVIESSITGPFRGWDGRTVFRLDNGQVWRQSEAGTFFFPTSDPKVIIRKSRFGSYHLRIEGKNSSVKVVRVE